MIKKLWTLVTPYRNLLGLVLVGLPLAAALSAIEPYLIKIAIDNHILQRDFTGAKQIALLFLLVIVAGYATRYLYTYGLQYIGQRIVGDLRQRVYRHILNYEMKIFDQRPTGVLLSRTINDTESLSESLATGIVSIFLDILTILFTLAMMLVLSASLSVFMLLLLPLLWVATHWFGKRIKQTFIQVRQTVADLNGFLNEALSGLEVIQLFRKERAQETKFLILNKGYCDATVHSNVYDASLYALMEGLAAVCIGILLWALASPSLQDLYSAGLVIAFVEYLQRIFTPIKEFSAKIATIQRAAVDLDRIFSVLEESALVPDGSRALENGKHTLQFEAVRFRYNDDGPWVIEDVSFTVKPGDSLAIVGKTGSGKTTLMKLLLRQYDSYKGRIAIDGQEIRALKRSDLYRSISLVSQDIFLFDGSIADNISLWRPGIDANRIVNAAQWVHASDFIDRYPDGYAHVIRERGEDLSLGQAQLLSFARAIAGFGDIVILDEATGSIDSETEHKIESAIAHILDLKTTIIIAHRLSTLKRATHILVMDSGKIIEQGTHDALIAQHGDYFRLYQTQFDEEIS